MKFFTWLLYLIKINLLQIIVNGSRNPSLSLQYLDDPMFEASKCSPADPVNGSGIYAAEYNQQFMNNITDIPEAYL
ncbi:unnamed protein product [Candida verbasci]|uniref:Uncharacterized protein n=1 Tax=Candida verbasci TaxID=1227364 RepID=A0A9W4U348_9ASCO|nr:unnamed protein product [Candida verbasci]